MMMKIPIVLWGSQPPAHQITCMTVCDNGVLVTGSLEGQLIFWTYNGNQDENPTIKNENLTHGHFMAQNMIIAHSSSVESLVSVNNNKLNINSGIVSLADNQELCLWNSETSCCLASTFLQGRFHSLKIIPLKHSRSVRESILAAFGFQETLLLIDPFTFQIIYILKQRASRCYIRTIRSLSAAFIEGISEETLLATTHDGSLVMYRLPPHFSTARSDKIQKGEEKPIKVEGSLVEIPITQTQKFIRGVIIEPNQSEFFILFSLKNMYFYAFSTFTLVNSITFEKNVRNIVFVTSRSVVVIFDTSFPEYYIFNNNFQILGSCELLAGESNSPRLECVGIYRDNTNIFLFGATTGSEIVGWRLIRELENGKGFIGDNTREYTNSSEDLNKKSVNTSKTRLSLIEAENIPKSIETTSYASLSEIWKKYSPVGAASNLIESLDTSVACSLQLEEYGFMIFGMKNGSIAITNMIDILKRQILEENSINTSTLLLTGHTGAVTCLCHPYDECNKHNPCHLLSGGVDFSVRLWNIVDGSQLKVYYPHGGYIQEIFVLSGDLGSFNNLTVISVASDYSVALINLSYEKAVLRTRSHTSPVYSVRWKTREDSLLVYCTDGTLFVWQITTGNLERCVTGKTAVDIFEAHDNEPIDISGLEYPPFLDIVNIDNQESDKNNTSLYKDLKTKRGFMNSHRHTAHVLPTKKKIFQRVLRKMSKKNRSNITIKVTNADREAIPENSHPVGLTGPLTAQHHSSACNLASVGQTGSQVSLNTNSALSGANSGYHHPFEVLSIRTGHHDPDFHVFIIDFDSLISLLVHEEEKIYSGQTTIHKHASTFLLFSNPAEKETSRSQNQMNASRDSINVLTQGLCPTSDLQAYKKYYQTLEDYRAYVLVSTAKLLISCLHPWGLEPQLDNICRKNLDLCQPAQPVCFGFMSRHKLQLNIPGWNPGLLFLEKPSTPEHVSDFSLSEFSKFITHWQISSVITGQHLVALISVANSVLNIFMMEMNEEIQSQEPDRSKDNLFRVSRVSKTMSIDSPSGRTFVTTSVPDLAADDPYRINEQQRRFWKLLFGRYCSVITVLIKKRVYYQNPCIHELVCYWLDSYDEIRHASYCILIHELQNMNFMSRASLVRSWCLYLPTEEQVENNDIDELLKLSLDEYVESGGFYGFWPSDRKYQRTIAIFLVCFIICEFPHEFDPLSHKKSSPSDVISVSTIILLSNIMSKLIKTMVDVKNYSQFPMRKAFLFFLGRAFSVWRPHINLSQILMVILDTNAYLEYYLHYLDTQNKGKTHQYLQLSELLSKHRSSLREIVLTNSEVFITVINKEYPRYSSANSYVSMGQSSLVAAVAVSNVRHQQNLLNSQPSRIHLAGSEIVFLIELMAKKCPEKFIKLIMDTIDLLLSCSVHKISKREGDFMASFPFLKSFPMIDFCAHTKRLVVGTIQGQFGVYDMKTLRCTLVNNFQHPVTCIKICPDGRQLVTYCYEEMRVCVWIMQVSILGLLSHTPKPKMSFQLKNKPTLNLSELRRIRLVWNNSNSFRLVFNENSELSFTS